TWPRRPPQRPPQKARRPLPAGEAARRRAPPRVRSPTSCGPRCAIAARADDDDLRSIARDREPMPIRSTAAVTLLLPLLWAAAASGQPASVPAPASAAHPDFSGVWMAFTVENPAGGGTGARFSAEGEAKLDAFLAQFREIPEPGGNCVGTGMPAVMLSLVSYPIEIAQTASRLLMVAELETQVRRIFIDG